MADTPKQPSTPEPSQENLAAQVRDLQNALAAMRATVPLSLVPEHGGGVGDAIAETWSLAEQEAARSGS
jgi:hypothetical protein